MIHHILSGPLVKEAGRITDEEVRAINSLSSPPPVPVAERDIYVRCCRLAGDAVDAYHGCFRTADLPKLLALIQGAPLLVGHDKRTLGVARFFGGTIEEHSAEGGPAHNYIVPRFYWLRSHSGAEDLRVAIDGGLYCEASLSFAYQKPTCSACGQDIRTCEHLPGMPDKEGRAIFYYYDEVVAVLEGSLVYRGAEPGTGFSLGRRLPLGWSDAASPIQYPDHSGLVCPPGSGIRPVGNSLTGISSLRIKRHGKWYRAPLVEEG